MEVLHPLKSAFQCLTTHCLEISFFWYLCIGEGNFWTQVWFASVSNPWGRFALGKPHTVYMHQWQEFCLNVSSYWNSTALSTILFLVLDLPRPSLPSPRSWVRTELNACQPQGGMLTKTAGKARLVSARTSLVTVTCLRVSFGEVGLSTASHWQLKNWDLNFMIFSSLGPFIFYYICIICVTSQCIAFTCHFNFRMARLHSCWLLSKAI